MTLLEVNDLSTYYEVYGGSLVNAVDKISFMLNEHDSFGVIGKSGCSTKGGHSEVYSIITLNVRLENMKLNYTKWHATK